MTVPYQPLKRPIVIDGALRFSLIPYTKTGIQEKPFGCSQAKFVLWKMYNIEVNVSGNRKRIIHKPKPSFLGEPRVPPEHGKHPIPEGKPDCLNGLIFVQTGLGKCLTAQEISDMIFDHGG